MAGHSKWANIKHRKAAVDAKRGKVFTKLIRELTVADIRRIFTKHGGNLGENGCVAWMFHMKGRIGFEKANVDEDQIFENALEAVADDVITEDTELVVVTPPESIEEVKSALDDASIKYDSAEVTMIPENNVKIEGKEAEHMIRLMEALEDSDDVQNVYSNFDIPEELIESMA